MAPSTQILLSGTLTFGVPVVLAIRELLATGRGRGGDWRERRETPRPPGPVSPARPLPDCLIPRRLDPSDPRLRVREPVA